MSKLQPVRGTHDLLPDEMRRHAFVVSARFAEVKFPQLLEIAKMNEPVAADVRAAEKKNLEFC